MIQRYQRVASDQHFQSPQRSVHPIKQISLKRRLESTDWNMSPW